ncbi:hypothetical protein PFUM301597_10340 [Pseudomonas fluorescens]
MAKRISRKAKGEAWANPHLENIAPLLHNRTNRLVEAAAATDCFERTDMVTTCNQAKKPIQPRLKLSRFFSGGHRGQRIADQPAMPTPGGDTTAYTGVLLTGGG